MGRVFERITLSELLAKPPRTQEEESEYRRGYRAGFVAAVSAVFDLWFLGKRRSHEKLFSFWASELLKWQVFKVDSWLPPHCVVMCVYCKVRKAEHLDHVYPKSRGGLSDESNLVPACAICNCSKNALTPEEWKGIQL